MSNAGVSKALLDLIGTALLNLWITIAALQARCMCFLYSTKPLSKHHLVSSLPVLKQECGVLAFDACEYLSPHLRFCHVEIPTLVFLTQVDTYDPDVIGQDLKKTFHSERLLSLMEVSSIMFS